MEKAINNSVTQDQLTSIMGNSYTLTDTATSLLWQIGDSKPTNRIKVDSVEDTPLGELLQYRLVQVGADGSLIPTEKGLNALNKRIALVYPLGKNGTIIDYDRTFSTATSSAKTAMLRSMTNRLDVFMKGIPSGVIAKFVEALINDGILYQIPNFSLMHLYYKVASIVNDACSATEIYDVMASAEAEFRTKIYDDIEKLGGEKLLRTAIIIDNETVLGLKAENGNLYYICQKTLADGETIEYYSVPNSYTGLYDCISLV